MQAIVGWPRWSLLPSLVAAVVATEAFPSLATRTPLQRRFMPWPPRSRWCLGARLATAELTKVNDGEWWLILISGWWWQINGWPQSIMVTVDWFMMFDAGRSHSRRYDHRLFATRTWTPDPRWISVDGWYPVMATKTVPSKIEEPGGPWPTSAIGGESWSKYVYVYTVNNVILIKIIYFPMDQSISHIFFWRSPGWSARDPASFNASQFFDHRRVEDVKQAVRYVVMWLWDEDNVTHKYAEWHIPNPALAAPGKSLWVQTEHCQIGRMVETHCRV